MAIKVLFFGGAAVAAGTRQTAIEDAEGSTAGEVIERLRGDYPELARQKLLFAVNEEYVDPSTKLEEGNEFAIFTAVSGG